MQAPTRHTNHRTQAVSHALSAAGNQFWATWGNHWSISTPGQAPQGSALVGGAHVGTGPEDRSPSTTSTTSALIRLILGNSPLAHVQSKAPVFNTPSSV